MFRPNGRHLQPALMSDLALLTDKQRRRLDLSWAGTFRREVFGRFDEKPFGVLYSDIASRPNTPVNVLMGLDTLKATFNWSDEEMHDAFCFDLQTRYALGYENLGDGEFELRTMYYFRQRVYEHQQETGENLLSQAFAQITDSQTKAFQLKTRRLRMDSTQIASNICETGRLQFVVGILQRVHRMLSETDQAHYKEAFAPYLKGSAGQYVYHIRGEETRPHLERSGELMQQLLDELAPTYEADPTYAVLRRVFHEQFATTPTPMTTPAGPDESVGSESAEPRIKSAALSEAEEPTAAHADVESRQDLPAAQDPGVPAGPLHAAAASAAPDTLSPAASTDEPTDPPFPLMSSSTSAPEEGQLPTGASGETGLGPVTPRPTVASSRLLSPDDPEATFRRKGNNTYQGYVTNVTETCDPTNPFQLIVHVQTAPNLTEDTTLLLEALPQLKQRTGVALLYNDAAFCGPAVDRELRRLDVIQIPSSLCGYAPNPARLGLVDFDVARDPDGVPRQIICPGGQTVPLTPSRQHKSFVAGFDPAVCQQCVLQNRCPSRAHWHDPTRFLRFTPADLELAERRRRCQHYKQSGPHLRAAVEATIGALKRPFSNDQLPVRGRFRVGAMMIGSALMVNVRRIQRYQALQTKPKPEDESRKPTEGSGPSASSFLSSLRRRLCDGLAALTSHPAYFAAA